MEENIITKAKISSSGLSFEFEGTEQFVKNQITEVMEKFVFLSSDKVVSLPIKAKKSESVEVESQIQDYIVSHKRPGGIEPKVMDGLIPNPEMINELKSFFVSKKPSGHLEQYAVIAYFLKEKMNIDQISIDEMYTCYRILGIKPPKVAIQVFRDAKSKKMWFANGEKTGQYRISVNGITAVEHDIPGPIKK